MKAFDYRKDTNRIENCSCERCANKDCRHTDQYGVCKSIVSVYDGLPLRCVGEWANEKIYYLCQYYQIFAAAMKNKWRLRYLEVCSGPGRCSTRDGYEQDGTALAIIKNEVFKHISEAIFIDYNPEVVDALNERIRVLGAQSKARAVLGDYTKPKTITSLLAGKSTDILTLCFIDPTDCSLPFETLRLIKDAANGRCDFLISFFDGVDFNRNALNVIRDEKNCKLKDKYLGFLGRVDFFEMPEVVRASEQGSSSEVSALFRNCYLGQLENIGLRYHDWRRIRNLYHILYASANKLGLDFWKKSARKDPFGQMEFGFV